MEGNVVSDKITIIDSYQDLWVTTGLKFNDLIISDDERIELIHDLKRECSREVWKSNCEARC